MAKRVQGAKLFTKPISGIGKAITKTKLRQNEILSKTTD
jgi:hypothetical protein